MSDESKLTARVLLLACVAGAVIFTTGFLTIGFRATKSPSLQVGTTIGNPREYFEQQLRKRHHIPLRVSSFTSIPGGVYVYDTSFVFMGCKITSRTSVYRFDTNGTVLSIYSRRYWPILRF